MQALLPYGCIEAGGTKFICGIGRGPEDLKTVRIPTTTPNETFENALAWFRDEAPQGISAIGIGSFGPVDLDPSSPHYGSITSTPKPGWRDTDIRGRIARALRVPAGFNLDVNAAAIGESRWGAARGLASSLYLTIGTGIGGGAIFSGRLLQGITHAEMGHIRLPRDPALDPFPGCCPFHGDCLEGLASGPAMRQRWGKPAEELPPDHPAWALEARYLAFAAANFIFTLSPGRIILGGGVMRNGELFTMIRREVAKLLNDYIRMPQVTDHLDTYIVPPGLGDRSGILGALALAEQAATEGTKPAA